MTNLKEIKYKLIILEKLQLEDKERHNLLIIKDINNNINNINTQTAKVVYNQVILKEDKIRIKVKQIIYLK